MVAKRTQKQPVRLAQLEAGRWTGELVSNGSIHIGQITQPQNPPGLAELSYLTCGLILTSPAGLQRPGVLAIFAPNPAKGSSHVGFVTGDRLVTIVSPDVNRWQFTELATLRAQNRKLALHFTLAERDREVWPISSWGLSGEV
jgi:hypothetical protein